MHMERDVLALRHDGHEPQLEALPVTDLIAFASLPLDDLMREIECMLATKQAATSAREARTPVVRAIPFAAGKPLSTLDSAPVLPPVATPPGRAAVSTFSPEVA